MRWATTQEIQESTGISYLNLLQSLNGLKKRKILSSKYGQGGTKEWKLINDLGKDAPATAEKRYPRIKPLDLYAALRIFARGHKLPKYIETGAYKAYAQAVGGLFKHAVDSAYGAAPSLSELSFYRKDLEEYAKQLDNHLRGVMALLHTKEIWDPETSASYILSIPDPPTIEEFKNLSESAIKENQ